LRAIVIHLGRSLLAGSSDLPGSSLERAAPPPLFGLAPRGVYHAGRITPPAVRSYRTFSPLPIGLRRPAVFSLWHFPLKPLERFPPAVSRHAALWRPDFPPAPCGASDYPPGNPSGTSVAWGVENDNSRSSGWRRAALWHQLAAIGIRYQLLRRCERLACRPKAYSTRLESTSESMEWAFSRGWAPLLSHNCQGAVTGTSARMH